MTTKATLEIKGLTELMENIMRAGADIDAAAQRALAKGADILQAEMDALVPVGSAADGDPHPGNLKNNITIDGPFQDGNFSYVQVGVVHADADTSIYGNVIEYGSRNRRAQSYIRRAIDNKRAAAMRAIRESLKAEGLAD